MNKLILIVFFCLAICGISNAQQEVQFTQFMYNKLYYNPAYAGVRGGPSLKAMYRRQWIGFEGAPESRLISFDLPLFNDRVGFGATFLSHDQGITDNWQANLAYSYSIKLREDLYLRTGFQGSIRFYGIDFDDPDFIVLEQADPSIMDGVDTENYFGNFGFGAYLTYKESFFGISIPNFYANDISFNSDQIDQFAQESRHFYAMAGTTFAVNEKMKLRPSVLAKYVKNAPFDMDVNLNLTIDNTVTFGVSYRAGGDTGAGESIDLLALYQLNKIALGLSYDITLSEMRNHSSGSFEAMIRYDFHAKRGDMANPRFFF
ncbi:MAG: type IX secretion system membrane protein PorP/SprF [Saprospiraceae bacterium]